MPRKPKDPREMTTEEAMRHLFGKRGADKAKKLAEEAEKPQVKRSNRPIKKDRT